MSPRVRAGSVVALAVLSVAASCGSPRLSSLSAGGIRMQAVEARSSVRDRIRRAGADAKLGGINRFSSVADVLDRQMP